MAGKFTKSRRRRRVGRRRTPFRRMMRKRRRRGPLTMRVRSTVFPPRALVKMRWVATASSAGVGTGIDNMQVNINSIKNPGVSAAGGNTISTNSGDTYMGYSPYDTMYGEYRVYKVKYKVSIVNIGVSTDNNTCLHVVVFPQVGTTTYTDYIKAMEQRGAKTAQAIVNCKPAVISGTVRLPTLLGQSNTQFRGDVNNLAAFGSNPGNAVTLNIFLYNSQVHSSSLSYRIELVAFVELNEVIPQAVTSAP